MFHPQLHYAFFPFIPSIVVLFFFPTAIRAQFRFDNLLEGIGIESAQKLINGDLGEQNDPLRRVFGIWGRLLNRMAQKNPPSDDELHLKGAQEGDREDGNVIGEDPEGLNFSPMRSVGFGGGSAKSFGGGSVKPLGEETVGRTAPIGPNKIIDEQRLNELLPRLNPNFAIVGTHSTQKTTETTLTTATTSTTQTTTSEEQKGTAPPTAMATVEMMGQMTKAMTAEENDQKKAKLLKKSNRKKKGRKKSVEEGTTRTNVTSPSSQTTTPLESSPIPTTTTKSLLPNENGVGAEKMDHQNQRFSTKGGETIQLRTSAEEKRKGQLEIIREGELGGLNETVLERAENETAQLIAEIETVLADAEMGPNGHWLSQQMMDKNMTTTTTTTIKSWSSTAPGNDNNTMPMGTEKKTKTEQQQKKEEDDDSYAEEEEEERRREGESYEMEDEVDESREGGEEFGQGKVGTATLGQQKQNGTAMGRTTSEEKEANMTAKETQGTAAELTTTTTTNTITQNATSTTTTETAASVKGSGTRKWIPEAEEDDQQHQQQIATQLQLDSAVTVSSPPPHLPSSSPTTAQQAAQNIFNLNANSNSYANPNFTNVMKPVNSIIDGIGPLILPLIGYSQRAFDAYAPLVASRTEGLPIFRPPAIAGAPLSEAHQQLHHSLVPIGSGISARPSTAAGTLLPSPQSAQFPQGEPSPLPHSPHFADAAQTSRKTLSSKQSTNQVELAKEAPTLEMLGRIIEERRKNEQRQQQKGKVGKADEISGSSPPNAELAYFPPNLSPNGPAHPLDQPIPERPQMEQQQKKLADRGYDVGRQTVHDTFHEDSGLMLGTAQQTHGQPPTVAEVAFGNGKGPAEPFEFTRR